MGGAASSLFSACNCVCEAVSDSLLPTMRPWLSFGFSKLMLWIMLACVPLIDVVSMATVPRTHWGPGPQRPQEVNGEWWDIEPRAGHPRDFDAAQQFPPRQPQLLQKYPEPPVESDREVPDEQPQLPWKYPEPPVEIDSEVPDDVQLVAPVMVPHLAMKCGINMVKIEVMQDLWGNGNLIREDDLTLGGCSFTEFDRSANVIVFESKLEMCGSEKSVWLFFFFFFVYLANVRLWDVFFVFLQMTSNFIIFTFVLEHRPKMSARIPITRTQNTNIVMQCRYPRQIMSKQAIPRPSEEEPVMP